jgi:tetratricopeptide (TPR) repeat protein
VLGEGAEGVADGLLVGERLRRQVRGRADLEHDPGLAYLPDQLCVLGGQDPATDPVGQGRDGPALGTATCLARVRDRVAGPVEELTRECEQAARPNDVHAQIRWRAARAKAIARRGEFESADKLAREAVTFTAGSDFLNDQADTLVDLAEVQRLWGRSAEASTALESAVALYEQKGNVISAAKAHTLLDELRDAP